MDQYIETVIRVGGGAIGIVMVVCTLWYIIKDIWDTTHNNSRD